MTVKQLIAALETMPPDADVMHLWDGHPRTTIEHVWLARAGYVVTADYDMVCYHGNSRPETAPYETDDRYWHSPRNPNDGEDA
jgi:hypothetical protein